MTARSRLAALALACFAAEATAQGQFIQSPPLAQTVTTAVGVVNNDAKIKVGESVVVFGAGGVGLGYHSAGSHGFDGIDL